MDAAATAMRAPEAGSPAGPRLRLQLLGTFRATSNDVPLAGIEAAPRLRALLQHLVINPGEPVSRAELASELWPDAADDRARNALRQLLSRLGRALPGVGSYVRSTPANVAWRSDAPAEVDVHAFSAAVALAEARARDGDVPAQLTALSAAAGAYAGDLVIDVTSGRLERARGRLQRMALQVMDTLATLHAQHGPPQGAVVWLERLLQFDPFDEQAYRRLMTLHEAAGEPGKALHAFERLRATLHDELGYAPSGTTQRIAERLRTRAARHEPGRLAGRRPELAALATALADARAGGARLIVVRGEPGIGKSTLVRALAGQLSAVGETVLTAGAVAADAATPYGVAARLLGPARLLRAARDLAGPWRSELRRLAGQQVPAGTADGPNADDGHHVDRLRSALRATLGDDGEDVVLSIDDAQHLDGETGAWLAWLLDARPASRGPYAVVVTAPDGDDHGHLAALRRYAATRGGAFELEVDALPPTDVASLAEAIRGAPLGTDALAALVARTRGHPLYVVEVLAADASGGGAGLPNRLVGLIAARLQDLPEDAVHALEAVAVLGSDATTALTARVAERPTSEVGRALDALWRGRWVQALGHGTFGIAHPLVREVVVARLPPAQRAQLHARAADALGDGRHGVARHDAVVARHLELAGRPVEAATALGRAAARASAVAAHDEAVAAYRHAIGLLERTAGGPHGPAPSPTLEALWRGLGDVQSRRLRGADARAAYRTAAHHVGGDVLAAAALAHRIATTHVAERAYADALAELDAAAVLLRSSRRRTGRWWQGAIDLDLLRAQVQYFVLDGDPAQTDGLLTRLEGAVERHGTLAQHLRFDEVQLRFMMRRERYRFSPATVARAGRAARTAAATGEPTELALASFIVGFAALFGDDPGRAADELAAARRRAQSCGAQLLTVQSTAYLSLSLRLAGRLEDVRSLQAEFEACAGDAPLYLGLAGAQRGWLEYRAGRRDAARAACEAALAAWTPLWYPLRWPALLPLLASSDEPAPARAWAEALLAADQQRLPDALAASLRDVARSGRRPWLERRDAAVAVARDLGFL